MAELSFGGLATGLPTEDIVSSLMAIERRPLERLEAEKEFESLRLQAYGQFNEKLNAFRSAVGGLNLTSEVRTTSVRLSNEGTISASSNGAGTGSYDIAVAQLAQVQKTVTDGLSSDTEQLLGTGTFSVGGQDIVVDSSNNSLQGLKDSINAISAETGVSASIINDGNESDNYHLVLTGNDAATSFTVSHDLVDGNGDTLFSTSQIRNAQQSIAYVDGIEVVGNSNTLDSVIGGVTINLNQVSASTGEPPVYETTTLNVEADTDRLKEKISEFVSSYNDIMNWIKAGYEEETAAADEGVEDGSDEEKNLSEMLRGDATINDIKRNLQSILTDAVDSGGSLQILSEIGISTQRDGTLHLHEGKLDSALKNEFDDVVNLLAGTGEADGVMKKFNSYLLGTTSVTEGMYATKQDRYEDAIKRLDNQIAQKEPLIAKTEERIRAQFHAMELLVSSLNSQSAYLAQQLDMLPTIGGGDK